MIYSAAIRAKAREVLRGHWQTALLIALIVNLPSLLVQGVSAFTHTDLMLRLQQLLLDASVSPAAYSALPDSVRALLSETGILLMSGLGILAWLVTPVLSLGMNHWTLDRIRGAEEPVSAVFSRLSIFLKSIGLRLFIVWKVLLWMLPGLAVSLLSVLPLLNIGADATAQGVASAAGTSYMLTWAGILLMLVLGVMGFLYYAQADFILADEPEERVLSCARRSRNMMKGRRSALLSLMLSFILWYLLIMMITSFAAGMAGSVIALMLEMLGSLFLSVYMLAAQGVFYEALRRPPSVQIPAEAAVPDPLESLDDPEGPEDPENPEGPEDGGNQE